MREIKFRAWDKSSNIMRTDITSIRYNLDGSINQIDVFEGVDILFPEKEAILMQYTGLKDKNGVEIYDGDIAECNYCTKHNLQIVYDAPQFRLKSVGGEACDNAHLIRINTWLKVIGNIYENPELLEEKPNERQLFIRSI